MSASATQGGHNNPNKNWVYVIWSTLLLRPPEQWWNIVMSTSVCLSVCVCVSVCLLGYDPESHTWSYQFFCACCLWPWLRRPLATMMKSQGEWAVLGVFFPTNNALYSIEFGTHTKMAEPIEICDDDSGWYHVLDDGPDSPTGRRNFWGNVAAYCTVMGHCTMSLQKWLNQSTCHFGRRLWWAQGTMY